MVRAIAICQISGTRRPAKAGSLFSLVYNLLNLLLILALCIVYWKKNFLVLLLLPMVPLSLSEGGGGEID